MISKKLQLTSVYSINIFPHFLRSNLIHFNYLLTLFFNNWPDENLTYFLAGTVTISPLLGVLTCLLGNF